MLRRCKQNLRQFVGDKNQQRCDAERKLILGGENYGYDTNCED